MRFSWKSFLLPFCVSLGIFSVVMACICTNIFRGRVPVLKDDTETGIGITLADPVRSEYESYLFTCYDKEGTVLDFAVLVRLDIAGRRLLVTPAYGDYLIDRGGSLFFLRSLCSTFGEDELAIVFASVTGYEVPSLNICDVRDYLPDSVKNSTVRYLDFVEILPTVWQGVTEDFRVIDCPLVTEENQDLKIISAEKTLEIFRNDETHEIQ